MVNVLNKIILIFVKVALSLLLGLIITLNFAQQDKWVLDIFDALIKQSFKETIKTDVKFKTQEINLIKGKILIETISTKDKDWSFSCKAIEVNFKLFSFLFSKAINTTINFYAPKVYSLIDKDYNVAILKPINEILSSPSSLPINLKKLNFKQAKIRVIDAKGNEATILGSSNINIDNNQVSASINTVDGIVRYNNVILAQKISGAIGINRSISVNLALDVPQLNLENKRVLVTGNLETLNQKKQNGSSDKNIGSAQIYTLGHELELILTNIKVAWPNVSNKVEADFNLSGNLKVLDKFLTIEKISQYLPKESEIKGDIKLLNGEIKYRFTAEGKKIEIPIAQISRVEVEGSGDQTNTSGILKLFKDNEQIAKGDWNYTIASNNFNSNISLSQPFEVTRSYKIQDKQSRLNLNYKENKLNFDFRSIINIDTPVSAIGHLKDGKVDAKFNISNYEGQVEATVNPLAINNIKLFKGDKEIAHLKDVDDKIKKLISGKIDFSIIKDLIWLFLKYELKGEGLLDCKIQPDANKFIVNLNFADGNIKIPAIYNMLKSFSCSIEIYPKEFAIIIKNLKIGLYKGKLSSDTALIKFNSDDEVIAFIPISFSQFLINWKKEFVGLFSGAFTIFLEQANSYCIGNIFFEDAYWRTNLFSGKAQKDILGQTLRTFEHYKKDINLNINIASKNKVQVKTEFINTNAQIQAQIKGKLSQPQLSASVELSSGKLLFPYKPLYITRGKIEIAPHNIDEPIIDLIAKGKIKKYNITLSVTGTSKNPKIIVESTPTLKEEQILILLLAGVEESSLYLAMPNLIMQSLEGLIFGDNNHSKSSKNNDKLQKYFKKILQPLKNVKITPSLIDASGKEIKGAVEIDINDRLRAKIQQGLDLNESPLVEVEYNISDDTSIKAVKNESDGIGAEVEMKWKF